MKRESKGKGGDEAAICECATLRDEVMYALQIYEDLRKEGCRISALAVAVVLHEVARMGVLEMSNRVGMGSVEGAALDRLMNDPSLLQFARDVATDSYKAKETKGRKQ